MMTVIIVRLMRLTMMMLVMVRMMMTHLMTYIMFLLAAEDTIAQVTFFRLPESGQSGQSEVIYNAVTIIVLFRFLSSIFVPIFLQKRQKYFIQKQP